MLRTTGRKRRKDLYEEFLINSLSNDIYRKTKILQKQANRKKNANRLKITKTQNALAQSLVCVQHYHLVAS